MMMALLVVKSKIKNFYEHHYQVLRGVMKGVIAFVAMALIANHFSYVPMLNNMLILLAFAVICALTPDMITIVSVIGLCGVEILQVSALLSVSFVCIIVIYLLLFAKLEKRQCEVFLLVPILSMLQLGYVVPVAAALFCSPFMILAVAFGVFFDYYFSGVVSYQISQTGSAGQNQVLNSLNFVFDYIFSNPAFYVTLIGFCVAFLSIFFIRRSKNKNASNVAILVGSIAFLVIELISNIVLDLQMAVFPVVLQVLGSMAIAYVVQFFRITLDYHGTTKLQFEDDEYYYYVTAIPKYKVTVEDKVVTRILKEEEEEIPSDLKSELEKAIEEEMANNKDEEE